MGQDVSKVRRQVRMARVRVAAPKALLWLRKSRRAASRGAWVKCG